MPSGNNTTTEQDKNLNLFVTCHPVFCKRSVPYRAGKQQERLLLLSILEIPDRTLVKLGWA
jgi:hypothetical protein